MIGAPCNICRQPIGSTDYTAIPAHAYCVAHLPEWNRGGNKASAKYNSSNTFHDPCKVCGKSHTLSPRTELKRGALDVVCRSCLKAGKK